MPQSLLNCILCIGRYGLPCVLIRWPKVIVTGICITPNKNQSINGRRAVNWPTARELAHTRWWWMNHLAPLSFSLLSAFYLLCTASGHGQNPNVKPWDGERCHDSKRPSESSPDSISPASLLPHLSAAACYQARPLPSSGTLHLLSPLHVMASFPVRLMPSFLLGLLTMPPFGDEKGHFWMPVPQTLPSTHFKTPFPASLFSPWCLSPWDILWLSSAFTFFFVVVLFCLHPALEHSCLSPESRLLCSLLHP